MESDTTSSDGPPIIMLPPTFPTSNHVNAIVMPIFAIIAIFISYLPFRSFCQVRNVAAVSIVVVVTLLNICTITNAFIWPNDNFETWWNGVGLCDIQAVLRYPITLGLATSLCCLSKGLADVLDQDNMKVTHTPASRKRKTRNDIIFCWLPPFVQLALHYIVQAGRFAITPVFGCTDQLTNSWPTLVILWLWAPIIAILNAYYAVLMLIRLRKYRKNITEALTSSGSGLAPKKFLKLVFISSSLIVVYLPVQISFLFRSFPAEWVPYSWDDVHSAQNWNPIIYYRTSDLPLLQYNGWTSISMSATMFLYFGFGDDAIDTYRGWLVKLGFAKIWPSLRESRVSRHLHQRSGSGSTFSSISNHLDLVGKALKHFDSGSRKASERTTLAGQSSDIGQSRKGSQVAYDHVDFAGVSRSVTNVTNDSDIITLAPAPVPYEITRSINSISSSLFHSELTAPPPVQKNFFSTFRTHMNIPMHLFHSSPNHSFPANNIILEEINPNATDLESQVFRSSETFPSQDHNPGCSGPTTETKVWSGESEEDDEDIDPLSPKLGTRAYRERERREMEAEKKNELSTSESVVVKTTKVQVREESNDSP